MNDDIDLRSGLTPAEFERLIAAASVFLSDAECEFLRACFGQPVAARSPGTVSRSRRHLRYRKTLNRAYAGVLVAASQSPQALELVIDPRFGNALPYNLEVESQAFDLLASQPERVLPYVVPEVQVPHWASIYPGFLRSAARIAESDADALATASYLIALYIGPVASHVLGRGSEFVERFRASWQAADAAGLLTGSSYVASELAVMGAYVGLSDYLLDLHARDPETTRRHLAGDVLLLIDARLHGEQKRHFVVRMTRGTLDYREFAKPNLWLDLGKRLLWWMQTKGLQGSAGIALMLAIWRSELRQQGSRDRALGRQVSLVERELDRRQSYVAEFETALRDLPEARRREILALWTG